MSLRRLPVAALLVTIVVLALAQAAATALPPSPPDPSCSPGPADCGAWHTSNVTVQWASPPSGVTRERLRWDDDLERHVRGVRLLHVVELERRRGRRP